tara:strand:+ start:55 stop:1044 length:990 start_codon:yes stop_codon:yes gene_type:complete
MTSIKQKQPKKIILKKPKKSGRPNPRNRKIIKMARAIHKSPQKKHQEVMGIPGILPTASANPAFAIKTFWHAGVSAATAAAKGFSKQTYGKGKMRYEHRLVKVKQGDLGTKKFTFGSKGFGGPTGTGKQTITHKARVQKGFTPESPRRTTWKGKYGKDPEKQAGLDWLTQEWTPISDIVLKGSGAPKSALTGYTPKDGPQLIAGKYVDMTTSHADAIKIQTAKNIKEASIKGTILTKSQAEAAARATVKQDIKKGVLWPSPMMANTRALQGFKTSKYGKKIERSSPFLTRAQALSKHSVVSVRVPGEKNLRQFGSIEEAKAWWAAQKKT